MRRRFWLINAALYVVLLPLACVGYREWSRDGALAELYPDELDRVRDLERVGLNFGTPSGNRMVRLGVEEFQVLKELRWRGLGFGLPIIGYGTSTPYTSAHVTCRHVGFSYRFHVVQLEVYSVGDKDLRDQLIPVLKRCPHLRRLVCRFASDEAQAELKRALPNCEISAVPVVFSGWGC